MTFARGSERGKWKLERSEGVQSPGEVREGSSQELWLPDLPALGPGQPAPFSSNACCP